MTGLPARVVHASRDEGSALVLALIVVALVGVIVTAVLSFAGNSLDNGERQFAWIRETWLA